MARPDRTRAEQERIIGWSLESILERLSRRRPETFLLLAGVFITQTAIAQQTLTSETTVGGAAIISAPGAKTTQVTKTRKTAAPRRAAADPSDTQTAPPLASLTPPAASTSWPVAVSLRSTLLTWAQREGWPAPQFLTEADWAVDVPGSVVGTIEDALKALVVGFGESQPRPRLQVTGNHVILVSEDAAE